MGECFRSVPIKWLICAFCVVIFVSPTSTSAQAVVDASYIDVVAFLIDPLQYPNATDLRLNYTTGGLGVSSLSMIKAIQFWNSIVNSTDVLPGLRFRTTIVWLPYPVTLWGQFVDAWCNQTIARNGTDAIPLFWIYPSSTGYTIDIALIMQKYRSIGFTLDVYSLSVLQVSNSDLVKSVSDHGGSKFVYLYTSTDGYEASAARRMNATAAQLGGQLITFSSPSVNDSRDVVDRVQRMILIDPDLVIFQQSPAAALAFVRECQNNFWFPKALAMRQDGLISWGSTDRRYWIANNPAPRSPLLLQPNFNDFYFPTAGSISSYSQFSGNWTRMFGNNTDFRFPGVNVLVAMSVLHQSILATGTYNDTDTLTNYIQSNSFRSFFGNVSFGELGEFLAKDRVITQADASLTSRTVYPIPYREMAFVFPIPAGCPPPAPSPTAVCDRKTLLWVQNSSLSIGSSAPSAPGTPTAPPTPVVITTPLIVNGNVSIIQATVVLGEGNSSESGRVIEPAVVNATGCINIQGGQLQLPFTHTNTTGASAPRTLVISLAECLSGRFDTITAVTGPNSGSCTVVAVTPTYTTRDLSVIFSVTNDGCQVSNGLQGWIVPVAVVCSIVGVILLGLALFSVPCIRRRVAPGFEFRRRIKSMNSKNALAAS